MIRRYPRKLARARWPSPAAMVPGFTLAARTADMWLDAAQVIRARLTRLAEADFPLDAKNQREIVRMGAEKIAAVNEAAFAVASHMAQNAGKVATLTAAEALGRKVLKPFHTRVKANVRRLSRKG